ncbi:SEL1-like repeat protein [Duganella sp. sic0402]|uniref:tetratricopeptide repeat protein n=1 Tax=Duganella sp. sic0402 TaxID=2854786 RepID=UPI001C43F18A|nr:SEL1-like repeat protein [Duganella sp. sic0402]MBV7536928.1 SEL1-like repeat protein [Duganella sp. sic0402]
MQSIRHLPTLFLLVLLCATSHAAGVPSNDPAKPLRSAYALLDQGDYPRAYAAFLRQSARNPLAQFSLGLFHQNGWGRPADRDAACAWYAKAARGKIPAALHATGDCLMRTPDAPGNASAALASYEAAASNGHLISLCTAAEFYVRGRYVARDVTRGLGMCSQAALANSPPAMLYLANYLRDDADVPRDLPGARHWYQLAAERQMPEARYKLAIMQAQGEGGAVDVDAALAALEELAAAGYLPAYLPTATLYAHLPPDANTGAPSAAHLAKIYLWTSAAKARLNDPALLNQAEQLLAQVLAIMPPQWRTDLDNKIAVHLAKFAG